MRKKLKSTCEALVTDTPHGKPLRMPWRRSIAMGRAYELLRSDAMSHLAFVQDRLGFEYCRFHGLFHDDMAVAVRNPNGELFFQWHQVDKVLDELKKIGLRPFVELGPMPSAIASGEQTMFAWAMNVTPPADWDDWAKLVEAFTQHVTERYGREEVRKWYFEVWNEPNLKIFWSGSQADYWILYEYAAKAIKRVDAHYRVGGPATARAEWIPEFLHHCRERQIPVNFISTHSYAQDEFVIYPSRVGSPSAPGKYLSDIYHRISQIVRKFDPRLEIHWTEWNALTATENGDVDWVSNPTVDACSGGAFVVEHAILTDSCCDSMAYWTASDIFEEMGMPHIPYSGTYGLINIHGIPKATFRAMEMLRQLAGSRLSIHSFGTFPRGCGLEATRAEATLRVLLWNNPPVGDHSRPAWELRLRLPKESPRALLVSTRLGPRKGSAYETWADLGGPANLSRTEIELLHAHSKTEATFKIYDDASDEVDVLLQIESHTVLLLTLAEPGKVSPVARGSSADITAWAHGMGAPETSPPA